MHYYFFCIMLALIACKPTQNTVSSTKKGEEEFQEFLNRKIAKWKNTAAPNFQSVDLQGNKISLSDFKNKLVLLNFWFKDCKPCITEIASLKELHKNYAAKGLVLLTVATDAQADLLDFATANTLPYLVVPSGKSIAAQYDVSVYPTSYLIDTKGVIRDVFIGASDWDGTQTFFEIKPQVEKLLTE